MLLFGICNIKSQNLENDLCENIPVDPKRPVPVFALCPNNPAPVLVEPKPPNVGRGVPNADELPPNSPPELCVAGAVLPNNPPDVEDAPNPRQNRSIRNRPLK